VTKQPRQPKHCYPNGVDNLHELPPVTNFEDALVLVHTLDVAL
jgi:hypothetical protein